MTATLWAFLPHDEEAEISAFVADVDGHILRRGPVGSCLGDDVGSCVAIIAGVDMTLAQIILPTGTSVQVMAAAKLILQDMVVGDAAPHVSAVSPIEENGGLHWSALFDLSDCRKVMARLALFDLEPDIICPAPLVLREHGEGSIRAPFLGMDVAVSQGRAFAAEAGVMDHILARDTDVLVLSQEDVERRLQNAVKRPLPMNLRVGALANAHANALPPRWFKRTVILAMIAAALLPALPVLEGMKYRSATRELDAETLALVKQALPDATRIVNARAQLDERLSAFGLSGGAGVLLATLTQAAQTADGVVVDRMTYDRSRGLSVTLIVANQPQLDQLANALRANDVAVEAGPIRATSNGPRAQLILKAQP